MENKDKIGKIYKIVNSENDKIYVGSTKLQYLSKRMGHHRENCLKAPNCGKLYPAMTSLGLDKFKIILLETITYADKEEIRAKEYEWIKKLECIENGYNTMSKDGEKTNEMKTKLSKSVVDHYKRINGDKPTGVYCRNDRCPRWVATWSPEYGKLKSKSFIISKYGNEEARKMAIEYRNEMIKDLEKYN
jgi:hypothetical protein